MSTKISNLFRNEILEFFHLPLFSFPRKLYVRVSSVRVVLEDGFFSVLFTIFYLHLERASEIEEYLAPRTDLLPLN